MQCPRCSAPLRERPTGPRWLRFFECKSCCAAFEIVVERHFEPCAHNPQGKFLRHTFSLRLGRSPKRVHKRFLSRREAVYRRLRESEPRNLAIRGDLRDSSLRRSET